MKEKRDVYRFLHITPRRIYEQLDEYVVGQKQAREVLAVAAYNHLKRIEYPILFTGPERAGERVTIEPAEVGAALASRRES